MATRRADSKRRSRIRHGILLLFVLPLGTMLAMLAPASVKVQVEAEEEAAGPASFRNLQLTKRPLLGPADFAGNTLVPGLVDVESLFSGARLRGEEFRRRSGLLRVEAQEPVDVSIVLDEEGIETFVENELFEPTGDPTLAVDLTPLWDEDILDIVEPLLRRYGYNQYDDFGGDGAGPAFFGPIKQPFIFPVPEPASGALVAWGVLVLAIGRRSSRPVA